MLFVVLFVLALIGFGIGLQMHYRGRTASQAGATVAVVSGCFAALLLLIVIIANVVAYSDGLQDRNDAVRLLRTETIYRQRSDELTRQIRDALVSQYPTYEKSVIQTVVNGDPRLILLRFPDLQASKTLTQYTVDLTNLRTDVYNQRLERQAIIARMATRKQNNMAFITALLPDPPSK